VYRGWYRRLLAGLGDRAPIVEIGAGPGLLKSVRPSVVTTDVVLLPWIDLVCDGTALPFRDASLGGIVLVDVLHHLARPIEFLTESARVLRPGGRLALIEPWVSPASYLLYRYFHHERCEANFELARPFGDGPKDGMDGNAAVPRRLLESLEALAVPFRIIDRVPFVALPYLVTFGFKTTRRVPGFIVRLAEKIEQAGAPLLRGSAATRVLAILQRA